MTPLDHIATVVLETAAKKPAAERASIYRDLATLTPDSDRSAALTRLASDLDSVDMRHGQLVMAFFGGAR